MKIIRFSNTLKLTFIVLSLLIVIVSVFFTNKLTKSLEDEERKKMELWAEATSRLIQAGEDDDITFESSIIEKNTTIPVYMTDDEGRYLLSRNTIAPQKNQEEYFQKKVDQLRATQQPIEIDIAEGIRQYIYYEDSNLLRLLQLFPYLQFAVLFIFLVVSVFAIYIILRGEQNLLWVGLSKETAHQLGTPISSLVAWQQLLEEKYPDDTLLPEMRKDELRLQTIAERFSKIGSVPKLSKENVGNALRSAIEYMKTRTSQKVEYKIINLEDDNSSQVYALINKSLFDWVIENLCKNAIDAIEGKGEITISYFSKKEKVYIDVTDNGKGIERKNLNTVFQPGYTTKQRGWGLGLSLTKRIIEQYHKGKIFVKQSVINEGTTFRIVLNKA